MKTIPPALAGLMALGSMAGPGPSEPRPKGAVGPWSPRRSIFDRLMSDRGEGDDPNDDEADEGEVKKRKGA